MQAADIQYIKDSWVEAAKLGAKVDLWGVRSAEYAEDDEHYQLGIYSSLRSLYLACCRANDEYDYWYCNIWH